MPSKKLLKFVSEKLPNAITPVFPSFSMKNWVTFWLPLSIGRAGVNVGGSTISEGGEVSIMTLTACLRSIATGMSGCCLNLTSGIFRELADVDDVSKISSPLVPSIATQLLALQDAVLVNGVAAPMRAL